MARFVSKTWTKINNVKTQLLSLLKVYKSVQSSASCIHLSVCKVVEEHSLILFLSLLQASTYGGLFKSNLVLEGIIQTFCYQLNKLEKLNVYISWSRKYIKKGKTSLLFELYHISQYVEPLVTMAFYYYYLQRTRLEVFCFGTSVHVFTCGIVAHLVFVEC